MEVSSNLSTTPSAYFPHHISAARVYSDLIRRKVRGPHAQAVEHHRLPTQLADVLDRDVLTAAIPIVLLGVDGHDEHDAVRTGRCALKHRSALPGGTPRPHRGRAARACAIPRGRRRSRRSGGAPVSI